MKIMIVDDDEMMLQALKHYLTGQGYDVIAVCDGLQALQIARAGDLDLIITDVLMPDFSGLDLLSTLKQFYLLKIPIIVISSDHKKDLILSSVGLGADDFIAKPINFKELNLRIKKHLHLA
jgi:DNA-binding response OmpR family regulator